jgi:multiple sugar transport system substrate-binding protein
MAACSSSSSPSTSSKVTTLRFWSWVPGIQNAVNLFNATHPTIKVKLTDAGSSTIEYTKLFAAIKAHNQPDVAQVEYEFLPEFESQGALDNIASYVPSSLSSNFVSWAWKEASSGSAVYAIPQDAGPMVLYYRADLFKKYGISVPTTWAQYASDAVEFHKKDPSAYITDFPADVSPFLGMMWQNGAKWFGTKGNSWQVNVNDPQSTQVADYWQNLLNGGLVKTDTDFTTPWYHDLADGSVATLISASWAFTIIPDEAPTTAGDWRIAPLPQWTAGATSNGDWGGSTDAVLKGTPTDAVAASATFAEWLNTNSDSWKILISKGGLYPSYKPALSQPTLVQPDTFYGGQIVGNVFAAVSKGVNTSWQWGPTMSTVFTSWGDLLDSALNKSTTLPAGLTKLQGSTVASMKQAGFSVAG